MKIVSIVKSHFLLKLIYELFGQSDCIRFIINLNQ